MQAAACPVCNSPGRHVGTVTTTRDFALARCHACGLVFVHPRPTPVELDEYYVADYFDSAKSSYSDYRSCAELNARKMWSVARDWFDVTAAPSRRLLDVGTATGGFLTAAREDGWDVHGVEYADAAAEAGRQDGLPILTGDIFHPDLQQYGLVSMWHVIEHVLDPLAVMRRATDLLEPGGLLLIETPNWNSAGRHARRLNWGAITPPEHIQFFTCRALSDLARRAGLDVVKVETPPHTFPRMSGVRRAGAETVAAVLARAGRGGNLRLLAQRPS